MAAVILVVGFIGMIEAMTLGSAMMDNARRQTLAAQILTHYIEHQRLASVANWSDLTQWPDTMPADLSQDFFHNAIQASGATYTLSRVITTPDPVANLHEVKYTVTWVVKTSRHDAAGNPLSFTFTRSEWAYFGKYGLNLGYQR